MTLRVCNVPGCPTIAVKDGRCPKHQRQAWRRAPGDPPRRTTMPKDWKQRRAQVLARDGGRCRCEGCTRCEGGVPCSNPATDVDHIGARDDHSLINLRALCQSCHAYKTGRTGSLQLPVERVGAWLVTLPGRTVTTNQCYKRFRSQAWCSSADDARRVLLELAGAGRIRGPERALSSTGLGRPMERWTIL